MDSTELVAEQSDEHLQARPPFQFSGQGSPHSRGLQFHIFGERCHENEFRDENQIVTWQHAGLLISCENLTQVRKDAGEMETGYCQQRLRRNSDFLLIFEKRQERHE